MSGFDFASEDGPGFGVRVAIVAPSPLLTITVEGGEGRDDELHVHVGGQGYWVARLAAELGAEVTMCATFGGETGQVVADLLRRGSFTVVGTETRSTNGAYVHDRRGGERTRIAEVAALPLDRHEVDDFFGTCLAAAASAGTLAVAGTPVAGLLVPGFYERLAGDSRRAGCRVVADVAEATLVEVLAGGVDVLKVSDEELVASGRLSGTDASPGELGDAIETLHRDGAEVVVLSRASAGTLVLADGEVCEVVAPRVDVVDPAGAGDSMTATMAVALAGGLAVLDAARLATAAAMLNVTRHGLGSGRRADIAALAERVEARPWRSNSARGG